MLYYALVFLVVGLIGGTLNLPRGCPRSRARFPGLCS